MGAMLPLLAHLALVALVQADGDSFDRSDGSDLGAGWSEQEGDLAIRGQELTASSGFAVATRSQELVYPASAQRVRFRQGAQGVGYVALTSGWSSANDCVFVKLQDDDADGESETVYFYRGNNSGLAWNAAQFRHTLQLPRAQGWLELGFEDAGDVAVVTVTDVQGGQAESFRCAGVRRFAAQLGRKVGVGVFGGTVADDWSLNGGLSQSLELVLLRGGAGQWTEIEVRGATASQILALVASPGLGAYRMPVGLPCADVLLSVQRPGQAILLTADAHGVARWARFLPVHLEGRLAIQALDLAACRLSFPITF